MLRSSVVPRMNVPNGIRRWQKGDYGDLTKFLAFHKMDNKLTNARNKDKNFIDWTVALDSIMRPATRSRTVYRGMKYTFVRGQKVVNFHFVASSTNMVKASEFGDIVLKFDIPKSVKSYTLVNDGEGEILIERNTMFVDITPTGKVINGKPVMEAKLVKMVERSDSERSDRSERSKRSVEKQLSRILSSLGSDDEDSDFD